MIFEKREVEVFEFKKEVLFNPYHVGECLELGGSTIRMAMKNMNNRQVIKLTNSDVKSIDIRKLNNAGENFLTERGVYKLIFKSRSKRAERFQDWVTDEVLPSIREHGIYATEELLNNPDLLIKVATQIKKERRKRIEVEKENEKNRPKVLFAEAVSVSNTSILVGDLVKLIKQNGVDVGAKRLFVWMRNNGYLIKRKGTDYNMPTQYSMDLKLFEVKETSITHSDGHISISNTPKVTGKGQLYFVNKFLKEFGLSISDKGQVMETFKTEINRN